MDKHQQGQEQVKIRPANSDDSDAIYQVNLDAFGEEEGPIVAQLAIDLLADVTAQPLLAFVAEDKGRIVGSVIFSCVKLVENDRLRASILAPLAVASDCQRKGVGSELVKWGLEALIISGVDVVFVYGDPKYYSRFGFTPDHHVVAPYRLTFPEGWMACEITRGTVANTTGLVTCASTLSHSEYW